MTYLLLHYDDDWLLFIFLSLSLSQQKIFVNNGHLPTSHLLPPTYLPTSFLPPPHMTTHRRWRYIPCQILWKFLPCLRKFLPCDLFTLFEEVFTLSDVWKFLPCLRKFLPCHFSKMLENMPICMGKLACTFLTLLST